MADNDIHEACLRHGAAQVYSAAFEAMAGRRGRLLAYGLDSRDIGTDNRIAVAAFALLSPIERAADLAQASIDAAKLR